MALVFAHRYVGSAVVGSELAEHRVRRVGRRAFMAANLDYRDVIGD
jgi:hypothetical protein